MVDSGHPPLPIIVLEPLVHISVVTMFLATVLKIVSQKLHIIVSPLKFNLNTFLALLVGKWFD
jgi:hypothetical protein